MSSSTTTTPVYYPGPSTSGGTRPSPAAGGDGSYRPLLVVLGVIAALLVISCIVGQVCAKRHLRPRPRRDRVAFYDDDMDMEGGFGPHGPPPHRGHHGAAKMEAAAPAAASVVETRPVGDDAAAAVRQTAVA